jgi:hypothetical protein
MQSSATVLSLFATSELPKLGAWGASLCAGLYTSSWGAFKDGPFETFRHERFARSVLCSVAILCALYGLPWLREPVQALPLVQLFFLVMGIERAWSEFYKLCFRGPRDPELFRIPQQFTLLGRAIHDWGRYAAGVALTTALVLGVSASTIYETLPEFVFAAFCTGIGVGIAGAYKDAPFEGFRPLLFFRSPLTIVALSPFAYSLGPQRVGFLVLTYVGIERMISEYRKTFIHGTVPGKFHADLPMIDRAFLGQRHLLHKLATAIVLLVAGLFLAAHFP